MQYLSLIFFTLIFCEGFSHTFSAETAQPYCYKNITEIQHKVVTKTRLKTVTKKGFFNKLAQKKETQVEVYEDYEPVDKIKVERFCCEGYKLNELDMCEPQCIENGCPANSKCVEPEVCECMAGYFSARSPVDNKHICEPICEQSCPQHSVCVAPNECACKKGFKVTDSRLCEPYCLSGCPHGGLCVAPNKCQCPEGFKSELGTCSATCSLGDQCQNGKCIARDVCICNYGFEWNDQTLKCEVSETNFETSTYSTDVTDAQENSAADMDIETDIDTYNDDIDPSQVFDELVSTTTYYTAENDEEISSPSTVSKHHKCPTDFVYHKGECKPLKFVSNEIDCRFKPCQDKHSFCLENGTCACNEGYQWFKMHVVDHDSLNQTIKNMCLTTAEYESLLQQQGKEVESSFSWTAIFFTVLGVLVLLSALIYFGVKLLRTQTGQLDVEGKNFTCTYDHRVCTESEKSVI